MNKTPSVLWITLDELHREALSCWGATSHRTPNIDNLVSESVKYTNAYTPSPICLPARCSLATGLYPHNSHSYSNHFGGSLNRKLPNVFQRFGEAGYSTSMHGKCHFVPVPYRQVTPEFTREYDHFHTYYRSLGIDRLDLQDDTAVSAWYYDDYAKELERKGWQKWYRDSVHNLAHGKVFNFDPPAELHPDAWVGRKAREWMDSLSADNPHFMWVSFPGPHYPLCAPDEYLAKVNMDLDAEPRIMPGEWDDKSKSNCCSYHGPIGTEGSCAAVGGAQKNISPEYWRRWRHTYYATVVLIDEYIGKIVSAAKEKWGDDLMIVFTCDHGDMMGHHGLWGKNHAFYEDIINIPLAVKYPGQKSGSEENCLVSTIDIFPTCLEEAGLAKVNADGESLKNIQKSGGRDYVLSEAEWLVTVVRNDGMKLTRHRRPTKDEFMEFYDLNKDRSEFYSLSADEKYAEVKNELLEIIAKHQREEGLEDVIFFDDKSECRPPWLAD